MDPSPDHDDRIQDFYARHGGAGAPSREGETAQGLRGWYEYHAGDGYTLRCDWSQMGSRAEMAYSEIPPSARADAQR